MSIIFIDHEDEMVCAIENCFRDFLNEEHDVEQFEFLAKHLRIIPYPYDTDLIPEEEVNNEPIAFRVSYNTPVNSIKTALINGNLKQHLGDTLREIQESSAAIQWISIHGDLKFSVAAGSLRQSFKQLVEAQQNLNKQGSRAVA